MYIINFVIYYFQGKRTSVLEVLLVKIENLDISFSHYIYEKMFLSSIYLSNDNYSNIF